MVNSSQPKVMWWVDHPVQQHWGDNHRIQDLHHCQWRHYCIRCNSAKLCVTSRFCPRLICTFAKTILYTRWLTELAEKMACAEITCWRDKTLLCARVLTAWRDVLVTSWTCDELTGILSTHSVEAGCKLHFLCIYVWLTRRTLRLVPFITRGFPKHKQELLCQPPSSCYCSKHMALQPYCILHYFLPFLFFDEGMFQFLFSYTIFSSWWSAKLLPEYSVRSKLVPMCYSSLRTHGHVDVYSLILFYLPMLLVLLLSLLQETSLMGYPFWKPARCNCLMILVLYICFGK